MSPRPANARSGITLTEILISILIMGVGLISLATLFPIGLVRLRQAQQQSRSAILAESAVGDMGSKNLLAVSTFNETYYGAFSPFVADSDTAGNITLLSGGLYATGGSSTANIGLPVCYDPLWRSVTGIGPLFYGGPLNTTNMSGMFAGHNEARFGAGIANGVSFVRTDPGGGFASAYGLQRITNFVPWNAFSAGWSFTYPVPGSVYPATLRDLAADTFVSPEDVVMQNSEPNQVILQDPNNTSGVAGSVVPMFFSNAAGTGFETRSDWRFSWLFTGHQIDTSNGTQFDGDIVVMENRPFSFDMLQSPVSGQGSSLVAAGETVVEAIFGYGYVTLPGATGYAVAADRTVLLRWPSTMPDPEFKVGNWIADVTYERVQATSDTRAGNTFSATGTLYPFQRCHWYQIAKRTDVAFESVNGTNDYRRMIVTTTTPLKARTLIHNGAAVNLNVALFMPCVVNVFQKTFYVR